MRHHLATIASGAIAVTLFGLSWAWAQGVVIAVAALCASLVAIVTAVRTLSGLAPVRWLWRRLIGEPVATKFRAEVREAVNDWWNAETGPGPRLAAVEGRLHLHQHDE